MKLYLVRHGKTDVHLENKRQSPDTPLGELGRTQALLAAQRLKRVQADVLLSSDWPRAVQTAEIIASVTNLPVQIYPALHEQEKAVELNGVSDDSEVNRKFLSERNEARSTMNFDWKFMNQGESLNDLFTRARLTANDIATRYPQKNVIAVSHGSYIGAMISSLIFGADPHKKSLINFFDAIKLHNAGVSILKYDEVTGHWTLISLNDQSHLD